MAEVAATVPLGGSDTPGDVAGLCLFLASPLAAYVTVRTWWPTAAASGRPFWPRSSSAPTGPPA